VRLFRRTFRLGVLAPTHGSYQRDLHQFHGFGKGLIQGTVFGVLPGSWCGGTRNFAVAIFRAFILFFTPCEDLQSSSRFHVNGGHIIQGIVAATPLFDVIIFIQAFMWDIHGYAGQEAPNFRVKRGSNSAFNHCYHCKAYFPRCSSQAPRTR
jgi:hypothetical protein